MALRLTKPFQPLTVENACALPGQLGIYELANAEGRTVAFGFAGARSLFGLRSELTAMAEAYSPPAWPPMPSATTNRLSSSLMR